MDEQKEIVFHVGEGFEPVEVVHINAVYNTFDNNSTLYILALLQKWINEELAKLDVSK